MAENTIIGTQKINNGRELWYEATFNLAFILLSLVNL